MRKLYATLFVSAVVTVASGCGQMGPLYMPVDEEAEEVVTDDATATPAESQPDEPEGA